MRLLRSLILSATTLSLVVSLAHADDKPKDTPKDKPGIPKVAQIRLSGNPDEMPKPDDPIFGGLGENFQGKLDRILKAKDDKDVKALYLYLDGLSIGQGKLHEMQQAIEQVRSAGKKTIAYVESGSPMDYLVALSCEQVCLPETGWLMLVGMRMEVAFYKQLFEMVDIKADFLQMGDFKGAAEPYTRDSMSPALRKQLTIYLDDAYENGLVATIAKARKLDPKKVMELIDCGPWTAAAAKKAGLVDHVIYPDDLPALLKKQLKAESVEIVKDYGKAKLDLDTSNPFALLTKLLSPPKKKVSKDPKIAVIYLVGVINTGKSKYDLLGGQSVGSTTMMKAIEQAANDDTVKAIVLRVDSPGGSALASDLIWNALKKSNKPVVASMGDVAASGGYYVTMSANKVFAEPGTLTGSIGVVSGKLVTKGAFKKIGITTDTLSRGKNSGILSTETTFSETERKAMRSMMEDVYAKFLGKALEGRKKAGQKMTMDDLKKLAGGRIWTGRQAKERGLVDALGTLKDAIGAAQKLAKMDPKKEPELLVLPKGQSFLDQLGEGLPGLSAPVSKLQGSPLLKEVTQKLGSLEGMMRLQNEPVWTVMPFNVRLR